jgi:hypothetical protein
MFAFAENAAVVGGMVLFVDSTAEYVKWRSRDQRNVPSVAEQK